MQGTGTTTLPVAIGDTIEIQDLVKTFGHVTAVRGLTFTVQPGRVTGFLGPNGAGKTTTLRTLLGLVAPTSGTATIGGRRYGQIDNPILRVGAVLEATSFHPFRRARTHLRMTAIAGGISLDRVDSLIELVGLGSAARRRVGEFSMGMRQRLELAGALLGDPGVLILDEPSNGLDPQGIAWLRDFLRSLAMSGRTVLVSSHMLAEMAQTIDDVIIISEGEVRAQGTLASLHEQMRPSMRVRSPEVDRVIALAEQAGFQVHRDTGDTVTLDGATPERLGPLLAQDRIIIHEMITQTQSLEDLFFGLTTSLGSGAPPPSAPPIPQGQPAP